MTASASRSKLVGGRYRLDRRLGEGGMGVVWAATQVDSGKTVALKMLKPHARTRPDHQRRLIREARAAASVNHPSVVKIHEVFDGADDGPVIVMDLLDGETLRTKLTRDERLSVEEAASILLPVVSAVVAAHAQGVVHRDLKPDNIFLCRDAKGFEGTQVLDFGIAKLVLVEPDMTASSGLTNTGAMLGTPWYMAPEQGFGERDVDARADIWALGVMLYEMLSGGRPVEGDNLGQVLKRLTNQGITPLARVAPDVPEDMSKLVDGMLVIDRDERLTDLEPVRSLLERYSGMHDPVSAPRHSGTRSRRSRVYLIAAGAAVSLAVVPWIFRGHSPSGETRGEVPGRGAITFTKPTGVVAPSAPVAAGVLRAETPPTTDVTQPPATRTHVAATNVRLVHRRTAPLPGSADVAPSSPSDAIARMPAPPSTTSAPAPNTILGGLAAHPPF